MITRRFNRDATICLYFFFLTRGRISAAQVPASITCPAGGIEAFSQLSAVEAKYRNVREKNPYAVDDCRFISHTSQAGCRHGLPHMYMCSAVTLSLHSACHSVNELSNHNQRISCCKQTNKLNQSPNKFDQNGTKHQVQYQQFILFLITRYMDAF
ncbi:hypothetical protein J3E68DRAFT_311516 [Trichoderma sp. SZMC 28012]